MVKRLLLLLLVLAATPVLAQTYITPQQLQSSDVKGIIRAVASVPTGACTVTSPPTFRAYKNGATLDMYCCDSGTLTWVTCSSGGPGGNPAWAAVTSGTNLGQTLLIGDGTVLSATGSGAIIATAADALTVDPTACATNLFVRDMSASGSFTCVQPDFSNLSGTATDAQIPNNITVTLAGTATSLAADPTDCSSGQAPLGINASGTASGCFAVQLSDTDLSQIAALSCTDGQIAKKVSGVWACSADSTGGAPTFDTVGSGTNTTATLTVGTGGAIVPSGSGSITATTLAANGGNCAAGSFPLGVDAVGAAETCTDAATQTELNTHGALTGTSAHSAASSNTASALVSRDASGNFSAGTITATLSGNASSATTAGALTANGANCSSGSAPLGIDASGAAESCFAVQLSDADLTQLAALACSDGQIAKKASGVWACSADSTGGSPTFDTVGSGTSSGATLVVGSGSTLSASGGTIAATTAGALAANAANCSSGNSPLGVDASGAAESCFAVQLSDADLTAIAALACSNGEIVKRAGGVWTCGADTGSASFDVVGSGTNTTSAMVIGTGGSLATTGSGTIAATTAQALSGNPGNCTSGLYAAGIDNTGAAEGCTDLGTQAELDAHTGATSAHSAASTNTASRIVTRDASGNFAAGTVTATLSGNASTSSALAADPANCSAGSVAGGVTAAGVAESCLDPIVATEIDTASEIRGILGSADETGTGPVVFATSPTIDAATLSGNTTATGNVTLTTANSNIDVAAHATNGGAITIKEGADDGTNLYQIKVPDTGLDADYTCPIDQSGKFDSSLCLDMAQPGQPVGTSYAWVWGNGVTGSCNDLSGSSCTVSTNSTDPNFLGSTGSFPCGTGANGSVMVTDYGLSVCDNQAASTRRNMARGDLQGNALDLLATTASIIDASQASRTAPCKVNDNAPAACQVGDCWFDSNAPAGQNEYGCTSTNTWTLQGSAAAAGIDITDVGGMPTSLTGQAGNMLKVNSAETGYELIATEEVADADLSAQVVTVCASGCDYATIQAALTATVSIGTASAPVLIQIQPGRFSECVDVLHTNDYTTLRGAGMDASEIYCATGSEAALQFTPTSGNLQAFFLEDLKLTQTNASGGYSLNFDPSTNDARFDLTIARVQFYGVGANGTDGTVVIRGTGTTSPSLAASEAVVQSSKFIGTAGTSIGQHLNLASQGNVFRLSTSTTEAKCWGDHGSSVAFTGTTFTSIGDDCETSAVTNSPIDQACGVCFYSGMERNYVHGMRVRSVSTSNNADGPSCWGIGEAGGAPSSSLEIVASTCEYVTGGAAQTGYGVFAFVESRLTLRDVRIHGSGPGTEYDILVPGATVGTPVTGEYATAAAWIRYDNLIYDSALIHASATAKFQAINPTIVKKWLPASAMKPLPATGAAIDANSEYFLFDAAADENASARNERVSSLYDSMSLYAATFRVYWKPDSATSGAVVWRVGVCAAAEDEAFPCSVSSFTSVTDTVSGGAAGDLYIADSSALPTGILSAGKGLVVTVSRDADNGSDTMTGDAALIGVEIAYGVK